MSLSPFPIVDFPGLDLSSAPDDSSCIDGLNFDLDKPGAVRSRSGSRLFATPPNTPTSVLRMRPFYHSGGDQLLAHFAVAGGSKVSAFTAAGTVVATQAMNSASSVCDFAPIGSPSALRSYVCDSLGPMFRWDGSAFTSVSGSPRCSYVASMATDNRLLAANISTLPSGSGAASASSSLVHVSDPGAPETWPAKNYEYLTPGDGDPITAVVTWGNHTIVFKRFRFFDFYGNSTDSNGDPIFNYRTVEARASAQTPFSAVAAPEGVYFASGDGVYLTTGGPPQRISTPIDPFFTGDLSDYWTGSGVSNTVWGDGTDSTLLWGDGTNTADRWGDGPATDMRVAYANKRLYVYRQGQPDMFVYDTQTQQWAYWAFPLANYSLTAMQLGGAGPEILLLGQTTKIVKLDKSATDDSGTAITSRYRSGFMALNYIRLRRHWIPVTSQESKVRETVFDGTGAINYSVSRDFATAIPLTGGGARKQIVLGTAPMVGQNRHREAQRGRRVSFQIEDVNGGPWRVESMVLGIEGARAPGIETNE